jgi:hypothetical protein
MSYELSGLPGPRPVRRLVPGSRLPRPKSTGGVKRRARPRELTETLPRLPSNYTLESELTGLGFSLKPPGWLRKWQPGKTLKKALVPAAIIGGSLLIPGVGGVVAKGLTVAAKGAVGAGKLALGAGKGILGGAAKLAGKGATGLAKLFGGKLAAGSVGSTLLSTAGTAAGSALVSSIVGGQPVAAEPAVTTDAQASQAMISQPSYAPESYGSGWAAGSGGGYYSPQAAAESAAPSQAGMDGSTIMMLGVGVIALMAVTGALRRR